MDASKASYVRLFSWRSSFTKTYILRDLGFPKLQWLSAALQQTTNEGTLQPARRSNLQAVEKSVTTPNQTARSVFLYIYIIIIIYALSILLSHYDTSFVLILLVLLQTSSISLVDIFNSSLISHKQLFFSLLHIYSHFSSSPFYTLLILE